MNRIFAPDIIGITLSFSWISLILAIYLLEILFIVFRHVNCSIVILRTFIIKEYWILRNAFSELNERIVFLFSLCLYGRKHWQIFVCWTITATLGWILLGHGAWFFDVFLVLTSSILLSIVVSMFIRENGM